MAELAEITVAQLPPNAELLDVREASEWAAGRAPSALHIPLGELTERVAEVPDHSPLFVICRSGRRSAQAAQWLNTQGLNAVNVMGGMQAWAAEGRPLVADGTPPVVH